MKTTVYGARDVMQGRTLSTETVRSSLHAKEHGFTTEDSNLRLVFLTRGNALSDWFVKPFGTQLHTEWPQSFKATRFFNKLR